MLMRLILRNQCSQLRELTLQTGLLLGDLSDQMLKWVGLVLLVALLL